MKIIVGILAIVTLGFLFLQSNALRPHDEPLADSASLQILIDGSSLPRPGDELRAEFHGKSVIPLTLTSLSQISRVLGYASGDHYKRIEVDLTRQHVYAYEGDRLMFDFTVSTGKWAKTPSGVFDIWAKVRSQKMSGGDPKLGTYYYLPNVPYVMFFYNDDVPKMKGFSFHGTYWHDNFGHPMSHGCVNMKTEEAQLLFEWADPLVADPASWSTLASADRPGTKVFIYGETPEE